MLTQSAISRTGVILILLFGLIAALGLETTEAFEWWKWTKYEKWNCCPGFNPNYNFKSIPIPESVYFNEFIQKVEIN